MHCLHFTCNLHTFRLLFCVQACMHQYSLVLIAISSSFHVSVHALATLACMHVFCMQFCRTLIFFPMHQCMHLVCMPALLTLYDNLRAFYMFFGVHACLHEYYIVFICSFQLFSIFLCMHLIHSLACKCSVCFSLPPYMLFQCLCACI